MTELDAVLCVLVRLVGDESCYGTRMDATAWDQRYAEHERLWSAEPNRFVVSELSDVAPGSALDLAAGEGRNAIWLAERGWKAHAVDFSRVAIERGREIAARRGAEVDWQVADIQLWTPKPGAYDLVLVAYLHLPRPEMRNALRKAAEAVAPGGLFLLIGHDRDNLDAGHGGPRDPAVLYTPSDVVRELAGFEIEKAERVRRPVIIADDETGEAIDHIVRALRRCAV